MSRAFQAVIPLLLFVPAAHGQGPVPSAEFQVNTYTTQTQWQPSAAALADGGFVIAWTSSVRPDIYTPREQSVRGQRFAADGTALGGEFQVDSLTYVYRTETSVAGLAGGDFVVVWNREEVDADSIQGQRYDSGGTMVGSRFQVHAEPADIETLSPVVAALDDGGFVVAWHRRGAFPTFLPVGSILSRRYDPSGIPAGDQFQVNSYTSDDQLAPAAAALAGGGFVVAWHGYGSHGSDASAYAVQARRYDSSGIPAGDQFQVNSYTSSTQQWPSVAGLDDGGFVVVWNSVGSSGSDTSGVSIQGQRYDADGTLLGSEFQVNSYVEQGQSQPSVAAAAGGGFVVAWQSFGSSASDSSRTSIQGRRFDAAGTPLTGDFQVNVYTGSFQEQPTAAHLASGDFVVAWHSEGSNGSDTWGRSVQGRRFADPRFALVGLAGKCLDVQASDPSDGTPVNLFRCNGGDNQSWQLDLSPAPQQVTGPPGKCLVPGFADVSGDSRVVIGECGGGDDLWRLAATGQPEGVQTKYHARPSRLIHDETGRCLDVAGNSDDDGTPVILFDCHGGANQLWRPAAEVCVRDSLGLCLNQERFRVDLTWRSFDGTSGTSRAVPAGSDDSGLLWFFEADNWEMLIKVLDGCEINDRLWVFAAATTTVEYTLTVTDTLTSRVAEYFNPLGNAADAITDTGAFAGCPFFSGPAALGSAQTVAGLPKVERATPIRRAPSSLRTGDGAITNGDCAPSPTNLCLSNLRFRVEAEWRDYNGNVGSAKAVPVGSDDSGMLWFFNPSNWEMLIKVLDACHLDDARFLMLAAATTDAEYTLRVTDTTTDDSREYFNPLGNASPTLVDSFYTCP